MTMKLLGLSNRPQASMRSVSNAFLLRSQKCLLLGCRSYSQGSTNDASNLDSIYSEFNSKVNRNPRDRRGRDDNRGPRGLTDAESPRRKRKEVELTKQQHPTLAEYVEEAKSGKGPKNFKPYDRDEFSYKPSERDEFGAERNGRNSNNKPGKNYKQNGLSSRIQRGKSSYQTYMNWKESHDSSRGDARTPHEKFFEQLSDWENVKRLDKIRKTGFNHQIKKLRPEYEAQTYDPEKIPMQAVPGPADQPMAPHLHHDLDRALFSPGVHVLKDPRTNIYNFPPYLESIMSIRDFDFSHVPPFVPSSQDKTLSGIAFDQNKKYTASTSSLTSVLTHFHFLISRNREPSGQVLSRHFHRKPVSFSYSTKKPVSMFLRYHPDTKSYSLDSDKTQDEEIILSLLGQVLEAKLTVPDKEFQSYAKSDEPSEPTEPPRSTYHYSTCGDFVMRSQIDCYDPRLPGTGVFDLKTRAVCAVRHDIDYAQIRDGSDYQITRLKGLYESYEREMYDLIRSTMFKYSLQARIGRMDGIFLAYHNIKKMFGFQYLPLEEMDKIFHSTGLRQGKEDIEPSDQPSVVADEEFRISMKLLSDALNRVIFKYPQQSVNIVFKAPTSAAEAESQGPEMTVLVNPMPEETIAHLQKGIPLEDVKMPDLSDKSTNKKAKYEKTRAYLDNRTLFQACEDGFTGELKGCSGYLINIENFIDGVKIPNTFAPAPAPGQHWSVSATISHIPTLDLRLYLENMYQSQPSHDLVPASVIAATESLKEAPAPRRNGRLTSRPDTVRRSQEEIADLVEKQLAVLGEPTEMQKVLRAYDEKGRQAELEHQKQHGHKEKIVWSTGGTERAS